MSEVTVEHGGMTPRTLASDPYWPQKVLSTAGDDPSSEDVFLSAAKAIEGGSISPEGALQVSALPGLLDAVQQPNYSRTKKITFLRALKNLCTCKDAAEKAIMLGSIEIVIHEMKSLVDTSQWSEFERKQTSASAAEDRKPPKSPPEPLENATDRDLLRAGICFVSKLVVSTANEGRLRLLRCNGLDIIAYGAQYNSHRTTQIAASSAIAAMGTWSGPRYALEIVETPFVLETIDLVLRDEFSSFPNSLKGSMMDAVSVLASRNRARGVLLRGHINEAVTEAVRSASSSRDMFLTAKASVAAGALKGKTVDRYGFVVDSKLEQSSASMMSDVEIPDDSTLSFVAKVQQSQYENVLRTQETPSETKNSLQSETHLVGLANYLSLARATAAATRGSALVPPEEKESAEMWNALTDAQKLKRLRQCKESKLLADLRKLARQGVPQVMRWKLWPCLLSISELREAYDGLYDSLLTAPLVKTVESDIDKDVTRTMPSHELFWAGGAQIGLKSLRSVLRAYAAAVPEVGYCQGMSSICALFLVNASVEEEAFLMLMYFMEHFEYKKMFEPGLPLLRDMIATLSAAVERHFPSIVRKFKEEDVRLEMFVDKWFMTGFTYCFPPDLSFRIWDLLLVEGNNKMFIRAALAVFSLSEERILNYNMEEIILWFQQGFCQEGNGVLDDVDNFLQAALSFRFSRRSTDSITWLKSSKRAACLSCIGSK